MVKFLRSVSVTPMFAILNIEHIHYVLIVMLASILGGKNPPNPLTGTKYAKLLNA